MLTFTEFAEEPRHHFATLLFGQTISMIIIRPSHPMIQEAYPCRT